MCACVCLADVCLSHPQPPAASQPAPAPLPGSQPSGSTNTRECHCSLSHHNLLVDASLHHCFSGLKAASVTDISASSHTNIEHSFMLEKDILSMGVLGTVGPMQRVLALYAQQPGLCGRGRGRGDNRGEGATAVSLISKEILKSIVKRSIKVILCIL